MLEQDYPDIEYIVVDGASKDNSLAVINEYKNGIDTIISEPDKGMYEAINKGIRAATGDIIGLIHSDDFLFSSHTISEIVKTFAGGMDFNYIGKVLLFVLGLYSISAVFSFVQGWIMSGVTQKICYRMRKDISEKINRMPMAYFESRTYGEVLSRITNDVDTLGQSLNQGLPLDDWMTGRR